MATTPVFLPGESPGTEEPSGLQSIGLQRVRHDWATKYITAGVPQWLSGKESTCKAGDAEDTGWIPGLRRSPERGYGNPLHYSSLENRMDRGAWRATVHGVTKNQTRLKWLCTHAHTHHCDLTDIQRSLCLTTEFTFFSSIQETSIETGRMVGHKARLKYFS